MKCRTLTALAAESEVAMAASKFDVIYGCFKLCPFAVAYRVFEILIRAKGGCEVIWNIEFECLFACSRESDIRNVFCI